MAKDQGSTIVVKKIIAGGHGHHGGAWKVAYADFVTAMMCFFMVMWLMGSDEEIKASISAYFSAPAAPWRQDIAKETRPLGDKTGMGAAILNGMEGQIPEDLVKTSPNPINAESEKPAEKDESANLVEHGKDANLPAEIEYMKFSILEARTFDKDSATIRDGAKLELGRIGKLMKSHEGFLRIQAHPEEGVSSDLKLARAAAITKFFVKEKWIDEDKTSAIITDRTSGKLDLIFQKTR